MKKKLYLCNVKLKNKEYMILKSFILFLTIFVGLLTLHIRISTIVKLFAFKEEESKSITVLMLILILLFSILASIFYFL